MEKPFSMWVCSALDCPYAISKNAAGDTFYKGVASAQKREKVGKQWTDYSF
jgi:hypothetical protein